MKNIIVFIVLWAIVFPASAQRTIDKHINFAGKESLVLNIQIADSIAIHTWNKQEVYAKAVVNLNNTIDNEAYKVSFGEEGTQAKVKAGFEKDFFKGKENCCNAGSIVWEFFIPENTIFSVETINGNITIDGITTEIKAKTISGFIDWTVTSNRKADLEMKTISGTLYTDLGFSVGNKHKSFPQEVSQKLNDGGFPVHLETISGDIFCRKAQ